MFRRFRRFLLLCALVSAVIPSVQSCMDKDAIDANVMDSFSGKYNAVVTVRKDVSGTTYLQLDDVTTLEPVDWVNPFKDETRALMAVSIIPGQSSAFTHRAAVNLVEPIATFLPKVVSSPSKSFREENSPVLVYDDWMTSLEDGYLTLHLAALCEDSSTESMFSLHQDKSDPASVYLMRERGGEGEKLWKDFIVSFKVRDFLPKPQGEGVGLNLHNYSYYGFITIPFNQVTE